MKVTKLGEMSIVQFYHTYRGKLYTSDKYPKSIFEIAYMSSKGNVICKVVKAGDFGKKTPVLCEESLTNRGIYIIETFEEGFNNL